MNDYGTSKTITFSGKATTLEPIGMIISAGQNGLSAPVPFFFSGRLQYEDIGNICLSGSPSSLKVNGKSLIIFSDYGGWGCSKIILLGEYTELKWSIG